MTSSLPQPQPSNGGPSTIAVRVTDLRKTYGMGEAIVHALAGVSVDFVAGQFTAVMGPSGSGKSTLLHIIAGLDNATSGTVLLSGTDLTTLKDKELTRLRRERIGFVFQQFNLVPTLTAAQNITLPIDLAHSTPDSGWMQRIVDVVDLAPRLSHRPNELSGGQQQRVAVARALLAKPDVVFADEPTGNLDSKASTEVLSFLRRSVDEMGQTIVMVTHDPTAAAYSDRVIFLADGRIVGELQTPTADGVLDYMKGLEGPQSSESSITAETVRTAR